jgi:hypothetical protein
MAIGSPSETAFLASEDRARLELAFLLRVSTSGTTTACTIPSLKDILILPQQTLMCSSSNKGSSCPLYPVAFSKPVSISLSDCAPYLEAETESGIRLVDSSYDKYYRIQRLAFYLSSLFQGCPIRLNLEF